MSSKVALVTGANRGIGKEVCRQLGERGWTVVLGVRDEAKGRQALEGLTTGGGRFELVKLDTGVLSDVEQACEFMSVSFDRWDLLVNNAGVYLDNGVNGIDVDLDAVKATWAVNFLGPFRLAQIAAKIMRQQGGGSIINVSSGMGQMSEMGAGAVAYRVSKASLNAMTRVFAAELVGTGVSVNAVSPGWVKTAMGGAQAPLSVEQGADTIVWLAEQGSGRPSGGFFRERKLIQW